MVPTQVQIWRCSLPTSLPLPSPLLPPREGREFCGSPNKYKVLEQEQTEDTEAVEPRITRITRINGVLRDGPVVCNGQALVLSQGEVVLFSA